MHFADILGFARVQKRTLVLPSCKEGQISSSAYSNLPLCSYFDLEQFEKGVDWVSEEYFLEFIPKSVLNNPLFVFIGEGCDMEEITNTYQPFIPNKAINNSRSDSVSVVQRNHLCLYCYKRTKRIDFPPVDNSQLVVISKRTVALCAGKRLNAFAMNYVQYAKELRAMAANFAERFLGRNFIAIQWRIEKTIRENLDWNGVLKCVHGLEDTVKAMKQQYNFSGLFLATDAPHGSKLASTSSQDVETEKVPWIGNVTKSLAEKLKPSNWEDFDPFFFDLDSGVRGILEKLVCARSQAFIYPPPFCFNSKRKRYVPSSYTREIIEMRKSPAFLGGPPDGRTTEPWKL